MNENKNPSKSEYGRYSWLHLYGWGQEYRPLSDLNGLLISFSRRYFDL